MPAKVIAVTGATGNMGREITKALVASGKYTVRAISRDADSKKAKSLMDEVKAMSAQAAANLTVVAANLEDEASLKKAFDGCHYIWAMTVNDFANEDAEYRASVRIANAAKANSSLEYLIYSTLPNCVKLSGGKITVSHFTQKARGFDEAKAAGLPIIGVVPGFFITNFLQPQFGGYFPLNDIGDGKFMFTCPMGGDVPVPAAEPGNDIAQTVLHILSDPASYKGKHVIATSGTITMNQIAKSMGDNVSFVQMSRDDSMKFMGKDLTEMFDLWIKYPDWISAGFTDAVHVPDSVKAKYTNVAGWLQENKQRIYPAK